MIHPDTFLDDSIEPLQGIVPVLDRNVFALMMDRFSMIQKQVVTGNISKKVRHD